MYYCEFHGSNDNGFGDIWWTGKLIYFSSIDDPRDFLPAILGNDGINPLREDERSKKGAKSFKQIFRVMIAHNSTV